MLSVFSGRGSFILLIKKLRYVLALLVLSVLQQECTVSIQIKISVGSWLAFAGFANSLRYRVLSGAVEFPKEDVQGVTDSSRHSDKRAAPGRALLCCVSVCACLRRNGPVSGGFGGLSPGLVAAAAAAVPAAELGCARCAARGYRSALRNRSGASPPRAGVERKGLRAAVAAREARGVWPLELPRQRFRRQRAPGSTGGAGPAAAPAGGGAAMAAAGPGGRDAAASVRGQKTKLSLHARELRAAAALQEQGRKIFTQSCEEKLRRNRERLPRLREAVQEDAQALDAARKHKPVLDPEVLGAYNLPPDLAELTVEEAREKLRATISKQANTLNMLDYQLRQRCRARDKLQRQLQQRQRLLKEELDETKKQKQMIRQLENELDKMRAKVRAAEKVGAVYERVHDALQEEVNQLTREVALMCRTSELYEVEVKAMEAMAEEACKAAAIAQEQLAKREAEFLAERSPDTQKVPIDRPWLRELSEKNVPAPAKDESSMDLSTQQDPLVATELEAAESQTDHEAEISEKMEAAKAAVQCLRLWNIPSKLLAQDSSLEDLENDIKEKEEVKEELEKKMRDLELQKALLMFHQPSNKTRVLEEELRAKMQAQQARRNQLRAQMLRNEELLFEFESRTDHLLFRLRGITVPGQDDSLLSQGVEGKFQYLAEKLQYLAQRAAHLPPERRILDESNETFVQARDFLEKKMASDPQNVMVSFEDRDSSDDESSEDRDDEDGEAGGHVPTREDIKREGQLLIESKKGAMKK
ncbi:coiled-coil domain-containing protein 183-like [Columba livia]|uniref:coiled-coil domain-containing protein 183-like n=1 Tax=Columba livia TaxID=8932 RepID=UPI0031B9CC8E